MEAYPYRFHQTQTQFSSCGGLLNEADFSPENTQDPMVRHRGKPEAFRRGGRTIPGCDFEEIPCLFVRKGQVGQAKMEDNPPRKRLPRGLSSFVHFSLDKKGSGNYVSE